MSENITQERAESTPVAGDGDLVLSDRAKRYVFRAVNGVKLGNSGFQAQYSPLGYDKITLSYDGARSGSDDFHLNITGAAGVDSSTHVNIREIALARKFKAEDEKIRGSFKLGALPEYNFMSPSLLGTMDRAMGPQLRTPPVVDPPLSGGLGIRQKIDYLLSDGDKLTLDVQAAARLNRGIVQSTVLDAPRTAATLALSGGTSEAGGKYALGGTLFQEDDGKPGIAAQASRQWNNSITTNASIEAVASNLRKVVRGIAEVSGVTPITPAFSVTPYASASVIKAEGSGLAPCLERGTQSSLSLGVAKELGVTNLFIQQRFENGHKPSVEIGVTVGDATLARTPRKCR